MRRKFDYFVNGEKLSRKEFIIELEKCCQKVVRTDVIADWCGISLCELDEERFKRNMRDVEKGIIVMFPDQNKTFARKEAKYGK